MKVSIEINQSYEIENRENRSLESVGIHCNVY